MQGFSTILQDEYSHQLAPDAQEYLRRIALSARQLDALTRDVLSYSRIVRSEFPLEPVKTGEFLHQIIDSYPNLQSHHADIHVQEPMPPILANPAALTQVVSNLLSNAVKFTRPGVQPDVHVRAETLKKEPHAGKEISASTAIAGDDQQKSKDVASHRWKERPGQGKGKDRVVRLWFEDNGIGIRKDLFERIFHMFQRLNPSAEPEGTGMGLTIVRKAIERMGGAVGLESEPGKGSRFWIELPAAA
jgi:signal transduction histidine kinase